MKTRSYSSLILFLQNLTWTGRALQSRNLASLHRTAAISLHLKWVEWKTFTAQLRAKIWIAVSLYTGCQLSLSVRELASCSWRRGTLHCRHFAKAAAQHLLNSSPRPGALHRPACHNVLVKDALKGVLENSVELAEEKRAVHRLRLVLRWIKNSE